MNITHYANKADRGCVILIVIVDVNTKKIITFLFRI